MAAARRGSSQVSQGWAREFDSDPKRMRGSPGWTVNSRAEYEEGRKTEVYRQWDSIYKDGWKITWAWAGERIPFDRSTPEDGPYASKTLVEVVADSYQRLFESNPEIMQKVRMFRLGRRLPEAEPVPEMLPSHSVSGQEESRSSRKPEDIGLRRLQHLALQKALRDQGMSITEGEVADLCRSPELAGLLGLASVPFHEPGRMLISLRGPAGSSVEAFYLANRLLEVRGQIRQQMDRRPVQEHRY